MNKKSVLFCQGLRCCHIATHTSLSVIERFIITLILSPFLLPATRNYVSELEANFCA